ncbi:MAG TPA: S8 family serine peptidase, partial [Candidatus Competibacteraceae bacterium]|nr:S8 family serine peptidase [Candidatus Competibacteraceae bacterium]
EPAPPPNPPPSQGLLQLSGQVLPAQGNAVDGDSNDPLAPRRANDNPAEAQPIPARVILGGYLALPGAGQAGASQPHGDPADWYRVTLSAGQSLTLSIADDGLHNDLDLGLTRPDGTLVDLSAGQSRLESLRVPADGNYLVLVRAVSGASGYILSLGLLAPADSAAAPPRLSSDFMPGEAVIGLRGEADSRGLAALGLRTTGGGPGRSRLVHLGEWRGASSSSPDDLRTVDAETRRKLDTLYAVKALNRLPEVAWAAPNYRYRLSFTPNDPFYPQQWHLPLINLPTAWDAGTGAGAIVAVLDTGVLLAHPDLQGQLVDGYDFVSLPLNGGDGDGIDANADDPGDRSNPDGSSTFHGTHVAGIVAAAGHNAEGVAGAAFGSRIMPLRVVGRLGGFDYDIEQAVRYAAGLGNDSGRLPARRADVINLSLVGANISPGLQSAIDAARAAGVLVVAAAGNDASSAPQYPAAAPGVISVSAVDLAKNSARYSNFGPTLDVAAPGGDLSQDLDGNGRPDGVLSTLASDAAGSLQVGYGLADGTSMASPHVAAVLALMRAVNPTLLPAQVDALLAAGALSDDLGAPGRDERYGHGLINAYKAVQAARDGQPLQPLLVVTPAALNFGLDLETLTLTVSNGGGGNLSVQPPTEDSGGWLRISAESAERYRVSVDRSSLADGVYHATITFRSNANTVQVPVLLQVARSLDSRADIGQQYVLLVEPQTLRTVASVAVARGADGRYPFAIENVPTGEYLLYSGSDLDNDGFICDPGESCGAYLTLDKPALVSVTGDQGSLDFPAGFAGGVSEARAAALPEDGLRHRPEGLER